MKNDIILQNHLLYSYRRERSEANSRAKQITPLSLGICEVVTLA